MRITMARPLAGGLAYDLTSKPVYRGGADGGLTLKTVIQDTFTDTDETPLSSHSPDVNLVAGVWEGIDTPSASNQAICACSSNMSMHGMTNGLGLSRAIIGVGGLAQVIRLNFYWESTVSFPLQILFDVVDKNTHRYFQIAGNNSTTVAFGGYYEGSLLGTWTPKVGGAWTPTRVYAEKMPIVMTFDRTADEVEIQFAGDTKVYDLKTGTYPNFANGVSAGLHFSQSIGGRTKSRMDDFEIDAWI